MKIGYLRFNLPLDIDYINASAGALGTDLRLPIIEALVKQGHEVVIYSLIKKTHLHILQGGVYDGFDYDFFKKVKYEPDNEQPDADVLFIEGAQGRNTMFRFNFKGQNIPYIWRSYKLIDNFKGKIFYYHHGNIDMKFPFYTFFEALGKGTDEWNLRVMAKKIDLFSNKSWCILTHAEDTEYLKFLYPENSKHALGLHYKAIPMCYSTNFDKRLLPSSKPEYKLLFVGSERNKNRRAKIIKYYSELGFNTHLIGKWISPMPEDIIKLGLVKGHGKVYSLLNNSYACIQIGDEEFERYGQIVTRPIQVIRSGAILFADKSQRGMEKYLSADFFVSTRTEAREKINNLLSLSYENRLKINEEQNSKLIKWEDLEWSQILS